MYVAQGLIDFLVSKHKIAQELREKLIFKVGGASTLKSSEWVGEPPDQGTSRHFPIPGYSNDEP